MKPSKDALGLFAVILATVPTIRHAQSEEPVEMEEEMHYAIPQGIARVSRNEDDGFKLILTHTGPHTHSYNTGKGTVFDCDPIVQPEPTLFECKIDTPGRYGERVFLRGIFDAEDGSLKVYSRTGDTVLDRYAGLQLAFHNSVNNPVTLRYVGLRR